MKKTAVSWRFEKEGVPGRRGKVDFEGLNSKKQPKGLGYTEKEG